MSDRHLEAAARRRPWVAYAAASWALIFGVLHVAWAAGWYVGLDPQQARVAFAKPWLIAYDLVVVVMCFVAIPVVLGLVMPWGERVPRRVLGALAWVGTALLVIRAAASLVQVAYLLVNGQFVLRQMGIWEPWFYVGAGLFSANLWRYWRRPRISAA